MKTFEDLEFEPHITDKEGMVAFKGHKHAKLEFDNGYGVSVLFGGMFYSNGIDTYELAMLKGNKLHYCDVVDNDVLGYLRDDEVTEKMKEIQALRYGE